MTILLPFPQPLDGRPPVRGEARGYACDWRNPGEALGLSRAVTTAEGGVDIIFVVPESNNNNESAVDVTGKVIGNEFWVRMVKWIPCGRALVN